MGNYLAQVQDTWTKHGEANVFLLIFLKKSIRLCTFLCLFHSGLQYLISDVDNDDVHNLQLMY